MQLNEILNKEFTVKESVDPRTLNKLQRENSIVFPSDLVFLYLNSDGLKLKPGYEISIDGTETLVEISDILDTEWIVKERKYDSEDDSASLYYKNFIKIANTFSQDRVLIGITVENWNQVYLYQHDDDALLKISDSLFSFLNKHLI